MQEEEHRPVCRAENEGKKRQGRNRAHQADLQAAVSTLAFTLSEAGRPRAL